MLVRGYWEFYQRKQVSYTSVYHKVIQALVPDKAYLGIFLK